MSMEPASLILVHGLYTQGAAHALRKRRAQCVAEHAQAMGIRAYECVLSRDKAVANHLVRLSRGTLPSVDAAEVYELDADRFAASLHDPSGRAGWQALSCAADGLDASRCFTLLGTPRKLKVGSLRGQRVWWFGRGQAHLSDAEFAAHYTETHGPLVASHASSIGLRHYTQVVNESQPLREVLHSMGWGRGPAPVVFAELVMGMPPLTLGALSKQRHAKQVIQADEQRHVDFGRSMLLLA